MVVSYKSYFSESYQVKSISRIKISLPFLAYAMKKCTSFLRNLQEWLTYAGILLIDKNLCNCINEV